MILIEGGLLVSITLRRFSDCADENITKKLSLNFIEILSISEKCFDGSDLHNVALLKCGMWPPNNRPLTGPR